MNETPETVNEIASAVVKVGGEKQRLILTENYVSIHCKKWFFREDTSFIPLNSIDSIFFGWKRYWILFLIGVVFILAGLVRPHTYAWVFGTVFLVVFWFYRPHLILVRSSRESLGGNPVSQDEAKKFIGAMTDLLNKKKQI